MKGSSSRRSIRLAKIQARREKEEVPSASSSSDSEEEGDLAEEMEISEDDISDSGSDCEEEVDLQTPAGRELMKNFFEEFPDILGREKWDHTTVKEPVIQNASYEGEGPRAFFLDHLEELRDYADTACIARGEQMVYAGVKALLGKNSGRISKGFHQILRIVKVMCEDKAGPEKMKKLKEGDIKAGNIYNSHRDCLAVISKMARFHGDFYPDESQMPTTVMNDPTFLSAFLRMIGHLPHKWSSKRNTAVFLRKVQKVWHAFVAHSDGVDAAFHSRFVTSSAIVNYNMVVWNANNILDKKEGHFESDRINKGKFLPKEELSTLLNWAILRFQALRQMFSSSSPETPNYQIILQMRNVLLVMHSLLAGGLRKQVLESTTVDGLSLDDRGRLDSDLQAEKVLRAHADSLPLAEELTASIVFFVEHVRPLMKPKSGNLWLGDYGQPLGQSGFSSLFKKTIQQFNPALSTTPLELRRMVITRYFASMREAEDFNMASYQVVDGRRPTMSEMSEFLGVTPNVMTRYYNRLNSREAHRRTQSSLNAQVLSPTARALIQRHSTEPTSSLAIRTSEIKRVIRLQYQDWMFFSHEECPRIFKSKSLEKQLRAAEKLIAEELATTESVEVIDLSEDDISPSRESPKRLKSAGADRESELPSVGWRSPTTPPPAPVAPVHSPLPSARLLAVQSWHLHPDGKLVCKLLIQNRIGKPEARIIPVDDLHKTADPSWLPVIFCQQNLMMLASIFK